LKLDLSFKTMRIVASNVSDKNYKYNKEIKISTCSFKTTTF